MFGLSTLENMLLNRKGMFSMFGMFKMFGMFGSKMSNQPKTPKTSKPMDTSKPRKSCTQRNVEETWFLILPGSERHPPIKPSNRWEPVGPSWEIVLFGKIRFLFVCFQFVELNYHGYPPKYLGYQNLTFWIVQTCSNEIGFWMFIMFIMWDNLHTIFSEYQIFRREFCRVLCRPRIIAWLRVWCTLFWNLELSWTQTCYPWYECLHHKGHIQRS